MIFIYKNWDSFCYKLSENGITSIPACDVTAGKKFYIVLKHDVETSVERAYKMAQIEHKYGHRGSYYVQAYLMQNEETVRILSEMQKMGHEISYHYDVMDSNKGDIDKALDEFNKNREVFLKNGFDFTTVCQHGNPVVERVGYTSNRDFFRNKKIRDEYPEILDIMVNFKEAHDTDYHYFSDAGRKFKLIYDPINNDIENSEKKNIVYEDLSDLFARGLDRNSGNLISTHPHRWTSSAFVYMVKAGAFKIIRTVGRVMMKNPFLKKIMSRYYYLAKKI